MEARDLFFCQSVVGAKLETVIVEKGFNKVSLCKKSGISRPTLDKILAGNITNITNYEKHIEKILTVLKFTPDELIGEAKTRYNKTSQLINLFNIDEGLLAEYMGVSKERIAEIKSGKSITTAECRDLAFALKTSEKVINGNNYFEPQISILNMVLDKDKNEKLSDCGFWGHIGLCVNSDDTCSWYPITGSTRKHILNSLNNDEIVIPCMNNKILLVNRKNVEKILLLDDCCDPPNDYNWDSNISEGEIPMVVYEALKDYAYYDFQKDELVPEEFSDNMINILDKFIERQKITDPYDIASKIKIIYPNGTSSIDIIDFDQPQDITDAISIIYDFDEYEDDNNFLFYYDDNRMQILINRDKYSIIELPLNDVEDVLEEIIMEMRE